MLWDIWSNFVGSSSFTGTAEEAMKYFESLHREQIELGYWVEDYSDEVHLYPAEGDIDLDFEPVAGMTCEG